MKHSAMKNSASDEIVVNNKGDEVSGSYESDDE